MKTNVDAKVVLFNEFKNQEILRCRITESDNDMKVLIFVLFLYRDVLDSFISLLKDYTKEVSVRGSAQPEDGEGEGRRRTKVLSDLVQN